MSLPPLSAYSTDDLIAEMQVRLDRGWVGYDGLLSRKQINYRRVLRAILDLLGRWNNEAFDDPRVRELRQVTLQAVDDETPDPAVYALNTTFLGGDHTRLGRAA